MRYPLGDPELIRRAYEFAQLILSHGSLSNHVNPTNAIGSCFARVAVFGRRIDCRGVAQPTTRESADLDEFSIVHINAEPTRGTVIDG